MKIRCVWEHNGNDTMLFADNYIGAFTRGTTKEIALQKMQKEIASYLHWENASVPDVLTAEIVQQKESDLQICDADSDVIFDTEKLPLTQEEYIELKHLALKSAFDFEKLYSQIPDKDKSALQVRRTFYGTIPRTANEMYEHTKGVNAYYFGEIGVDADNKGTIFECRQKGFSLLEAQSDYLRNQVHCGSYNEEWSLRKVFRRFIWHDRIHAKAMYRMAQKTFGHDIVEDVFQFDT